MAAISPCSTCPTCHQPLPGPASEADQKAIRAKSTDKDAQNRKLVALLRLRPQHTYELRKQGISHPAGRVQDLEEAGYVLESDRLTVVDAHGFRHCNVAIYMLVSEPEDGAEVACS
jgi:hypothetical protein